MEFFRNNLIYWIASLLLSASPAALADQTLNTVCGPQSQNKYAGNPQLGTLCSAAYTNGNLWVINDNSSRVRTSVAVVCAYSCLSGGMTSCSGPDGGGSACNTAVNNGWSAYNYSNASDDALNAAKRNGGSALSYQQGGIAVSSSQASTSNASSPSVTLPASCQGLASGATVQGRIQCAMDSDPSLPAFVQSAQFQQDFQNITGTSLQSVINQSGPTVLDQYATGAIQHAYGTVQGKMSFTDLVKNGASLIGGMIGNLSTSDDKMKFLTRVLPSSVRGVVGGMLALNGNGTAPRAPQSAGMALANSPSGAVGSEKSGSAIADAASDKALFQSQDASMDRTPANLGNSPELNPRISLFVRVTSRYQQSDLFTGRVSLSSWPKSTRSR